MDSITADLKAETEALMWQYLDAHKKDDRPKQKRLYDEIMLRCQLLSAAIGAEEDDLAGVER